MRLLDRYILGELIRSVLLTTAVLVTVIAFGAAIKPLTNSSLLTAGQTAKYVVLAIVPMLQFALPFAAGFAGTLSMHRMTTDNEIIAAATSGISYRRILRPILVLGLALTVVMLVLTQWVIPRFWALLEAAVAEDVTRMFQAQIARGEPFTIGDRQIYADDIFVDNDPEGTDADTRLILLRVAAIDLDEEGGIARDMTANQAVIDIYRRETATYITMTMSDAVAYQQQGGVLAWAERFEPAAIVIPRARRRATSHMTRGEMLELRTDPDASGDVIKARHALAEVVREVELWREVDRQLRETGSILLQARTPDRPTYEVVAAGLDKRQFTAPPGGAVVIRRIEDGRVQRRFSAAEARISRHDVGPLGPVTFDLALSGVEVEDVALPGPVNRRESLPLKNLAFEADDGEALLALSSAALIARAEGLDARNRLRGAMNHLETRIASLQREITSRLHRRYAMAVTAALLLLLGSTLAMWRREGAPLSIYLWAFLPSIVDVIVISSGGHMIRDGAVASGFAVMWSGNGVLLAMFAFSFFRLAKH